MIDPLHLRDDLEHLLRERHRRNCVHENAGTSGGVCARCDAEAVVEYVAALLPPELPPKVCDLYVPHYPHGRCPGVERKDETA